MEVKEKLGVIKLYHHTSSQFFMEKIMKEGIINNDIDHDNSTCLTNDIFNSAARSEMAVDKGNKDKLNIMITLVINAEMEKLNPLWEKSLDETEECLSNKPISIDSIEKVLFQFIETEAYNDKKFHKEYEKFEEFLRKYIKEELSVKEAYEGLLKAQEEYDKI